MISVGGERPQVEQTPSAEVRRLADFVAVPSNARRLSQLINDLQNPKFRIGQKVWLLDASRAQQGPYKVESNDQRIYKLRDSALRLVENGKEFEEKDLARYVPFQ